jgi:MFS family permease
MRVDATRSSTRNEEHTSTLMTALAPTMIVVLVAYLIIGLAMPVLPLYVNKELGLSTFMVGLAAGVEFAAALVSRFWSGRYADTQGPKRAIVAGLLMGAVAGLLYFGSLGFARTPGAAIHSRPSLLRPFARQGGRRAGRAGLHRQ